MGIEIGKAALTTSDRIEFLRTLSGWLTSGGGRMSVSEAVAFTCEVFGRDEYRTFAARMDRIAREVQSGQVPFHEALRIAKLGFGRQELAILKAAEENNQLRSATSALVAALEMRQQGRKSLVRKLTMPLIGGFMLVIMSLGVLIFMLPTVMGPVLARNPEKLADFPFIIRWYWHASVWLNQNWEIPLVAFIAVVAAIFLRKSIFLRRYYERIILGFGPSRRLVLAFNAMLLVYFMPALVRSGMPFHEVLSSLANAMESDKLAGQLRLAATENEAGFTLGQALVHLPFRSSFRSAIEAGEKTGQIAERVEELQRPYAADLERAIRSTVGVITLIVMALLLPFFMMSVYVTLVAPIFALMEF